jgi:dCMP deaminase
MNDDIDKLKYRNEIEVMSRLRNYKVNDLYNDISNKINELYPSQDLYVYNDNPTVNDITLQSISWDSYFMNVAVLTSKRSKDENTKVGACLIDSSNRIIGCGYNGFIKGADNTVFPSAREGEWINTKYPFVVHAELNAILNTTVFDLSNSKLYCTLFPCNDCAKVIIQKGISEVIYLSDKHHDDPPYIASRKLLDSAKIITRQYDGEILL